MLRSMYSGISGMKVNQTKLDVIGNNIANVGTTSFKSSRARFSDMLSQNVSDAMSPANNKGGVNASQVGLGVQLASIDSVMTQGMMQPTGRTLDVAIDGAGFFMVSNGPVINDGALEVNHIAGAHRITSQSLVNSNAEIMYSRDGSFTLDQQGNLLTGDGFRVMGYSLTNDDSSMVATGKQPNNVSTGGLDFRFGPGSQLNGYKIVLGTVGPGTVTTGDIDKNQKLIVVNGDFSTVNGLTAAQVESSLNKGLSSAGISQQVFVIGKPTNIAGLGSESVKGGSNAISPDSVTVMGATFTFAEGSALNDYTINVGKISESKTNATVDNQLKTITINANFVEKGAVTSTDLGDAITKALKTGGINQEVKGSGSIAQLPGLIASSDDKGTESKVPSSYIKDGFNIVFQTAGDKEKCAELNGFTIEFKEDSIATEHKYDIDKTGGKILVTVAKGIVPGMVVKPAPTALEFNTFLKSKGINDVELEALTIAPGGGKAFIASDGENLTAPKSVIIAEGLTIKLPKGDKFNNVEVKIESLDSPALAADRVKIEVANGKVTKIRLQGDFRNQNIDTTALENEINAAILASGIYGSTELTDNQKVSITGNSKPIKGLSSSVINGGEVTAAPGNQSVFGFDFEFANGEALNGYKINIGQVTSGTKTSADIDEKNKTITINGNFVTAGAITANSIKSIVNVALQEKGIDQTIKITGTPDRLPSVESEETSGGTPVGSINVEGTINFIDGTKTLKAYDGQLKTLKIPDKVRIPGTDQELRVKTYTIDSTGIINGVLEDGRVTALGQIGMANFKNPEGLAKLGGNLYSSSVNSGDAIIKSGIGTLGDDNSKGYGENLQGMLEMSNVDLAEQFTDMIISTRAFQAAGKMITTGDEILQDIINLKR